MVEQSSLTPTADIAGKAVTQFGFWIAILTAVVAAISFAIAVTTLPISGPFCQTGCVTYPYRAVVAYIPHDYLWMYPATFLTPMFVVLMVCLHRYCAPGKKLYSQIALSFAVISATVITIDYYIQIATMQPSILRGETEGLALFSQYNPHGVFIALEELGYLMMSVAFLFVSAVFAATSKLERALRWLFLTGALAAFATYVVLSWLFGKELEYRFEVAIITINLTVLFAGGVLLSVLFRRAARGG